MMLKRWPFILVAAWLINTLVCFHPSSFNESGKAVAVSVNNDFADNTLVDIFFNHCIGQNDKHPHKRINSRSKFVAPRVLDVNLQLPSLFSFENLAIAKCATATQFAQWDNRLFLPPLHHFLFRLSPF